MTLGEVQSSGARADEIELRILSGIHRGAAMSLIDEPVALGCHPDCDVVLLDAGIQALHLRVVQRDAKWWAEPVDGASCKLANGQNLGVAVAIEPKLALCAADVWIAFASIDAPWDPPPESIASKPEEAAVTTSASARLPGQAAPAKRHRPMRLALLIAALMAAGGLAAGALMLDADASRLRAAETVAVAALQKPPMRRSADQLRSDALGMLRDRQLEAVVQITTRAGYLFMEGELTSQERERFEESLLAMQRQFGATTEIEAKLTPLSAALPFGIQQVLMGRDSRIVLTNGREMYEGDLVAGFRLVAVRPGKLLFMGKRKVEISW
ncbi:type III secretion protein D [Variovorax boronicumulans]|uniref:FHA domain-containing protein n=1 Tax=Variovorax boronicumulans TaxID=436515 RepID=UPI00277F1B1B|nr:FHA domain-containing protein [Variovorax boronicumulans]MDQ0083801.1 type III secretion protein D [Variovorax boronicumulans]